MKAKGQAKVSGSLPNGAKVSGNAQLMVGDRECALAFSSAKKGGELSFLLWFCENGAVECANLNNSSWTVQCANARSGATLEAGSRFRVDANELSRLVPGLSKDFLPDGLAVSMSGGKFAIDKAGKVALQKDTGYDVAKAGTNPSGLMLSYKTKTCTFAGKFTVYVLVGGKIKKTAVAVTGVVLDGRGYGSATVKKVGSVPVTIHP